MRLREKKGKKQPRFRANRAFNVRNAARQGREEKSEINLLITRPLIVNGRHHARDFLRVCARNLATRAFAPFFLSRCSSTAKVHVTNFRPQELAAQSNGFTIQTNFILREKIRGQQQKFLQLVVRRS